MSDPRETPPRFTPAQLREMADEEAYGRLHGGRCGCWNCLQSRTRERIYLQAAEDAETLKQRDEENAALRAQLAQVTQERDDLLSSKALK